MKPFLVNLKPLYQCPAIWFWHLLGGIVCFSLFIRPLTNPEAGESVFSGFIGITFWSGMMGISLAKDFWVKPFSFCLPGHTRISGKVLLCIGGVVSAVCSLTFLAFPTTTGGDTLAAVWSAFALGFVVYLAILFVIIAVNHGGFVWAFVITMLAVLDHDLFSGFRVVLVRSTVGHPIIVSVLLGIALIFAWKKLSDRRLARKLCGINFFPPHAVWSTIRTERFQSEEQLRRLKSKSIRHIKILEKRFLPRMKKRSRYSSGKFTWGIFYTLSAKMALINRSSLLLYVFAILFGPVILGYIGPTRLFPDFSLANFIFLVGIFTVCSFQVANPFTTMLLPTSRKERFWSLVIMGFVLGVIAVVLGGVVIAISLAVEHLAHEVSLFGKTFTYFPLIPEALFNFLIVLPIYMGCQILFPKHYGIATGVLAGLAAVIIRKDLPEILTLSPTGIVLLQLACWSPFVYLAYYYSISRDLVLKGK